jgi:hypothetical protein
MRQISPIFVVILLSFFTILSCAPKEQTQTQDVLENIEPPQAEVKPGYIHTVYFWLKKDNPELLAEFMNEALPKLAEVPSIQSVSWGPPGSTLRDVVDSSYDLAWIVNFASAEDEEKYQVDPLHVEFVEKYKSIFEKVQVYDNIVDHYVSK